LEDRELDALGGCNTPKKKSVSLKDTRLMDIAEAFVCHLFYQNWKDIKNGRSYKYRAKHIEVIWGDVPTEEFQEANGPTIYALRVEQAMRKTRT
jgi:hypothetical protein